MKSRWILPLAAALAAGAAFHFGWRFPWHLALIAGAGIGVLVWTTRSTVERLRALYRPGGAPGEGDERCGEQQVGEAAEREAGQQQRHPGGERQTGDMESSTRSHGSIRA